MAPVVHQHHIVPKGMGGRHGPMKVLINDERNGMAVCRSCHDSVSFWNEDAADLVPGKEFRRDLAAGKFRRAY